MREGAASWRRWHLNQTLQALLIGKGQIGVGQEGQAEEGVPGLKTSW